MNTPASELHVAAVQTALHWEDAQANRRHFSAIFRQLMSEDDKPKPDLIVLPEMFSTGFSMAPERLAEQPAGPTTQWMQEQAALHNAVITGSIIVTENGYYYNRLIWAEPDGTVKHYNKRHLFRMGNEDKHYTAGTEKLIVELKGWKVCPLICYDLRFPVWSRNTFKANNNEAPTADYDLLLYVANWPEVRSHIWHVLLRARAIENQAYVVGINRIGNDGNNVPHDGLSDIMNFTGDSLRSADYNSPDVLRTSLSYENLLLFRKNFPAGLDADAFELK